MEVELWKQIVTGIVVVVVFVAFVKEWFSPDLVAMGAFVFLVLVGVMDSDRALMVFGSSAAEQDAQQRIDPNFTDYKYFLYAVAEVRLHLINKQGAIQVEIEKMRQELAKAQEPDLLNSVRFQALNEYYAYVRAQIKQYDTLKAFVETSDRYEDIENHILNTSMGTLDYLMVQK